MPVKELMWIVICLILLLWILELILYRMAKKYCTTALAVNYKMLSVLDRDVANMRVWIDHHTTILSGEDEGLSVAITDTVKGAVSELRLNAADIDAIAIRVIELTPPQLPIVVPTYTQYPPPFPPNGPTCTPPTT